MYRWSTIKNRLLPTVAQALRAIKKAEAEGDSRDVRPLMDCLQRLEEVDPRLGGHILSRRSAVTAFPFTIESVDGESDGAEQLAERARRRLDSVIREVMHYQLRAALYGALVMRLDIEYMDAMDAQIYSVDKIFAPTEVERASSRAQDVRIIDDNGLGVMERTAVPDDDLHIVAVGEESWVGGALRQVLFHEILRHNALQDWANFTRKLKGIIQAVMEGGVPPEGDPERQVAMDALRTLVEENYTVTGDRTTFNFNELVDAASGQSFKGFKKDRDADIAFAILGQNGTGELPEHGGSRAALQVLNLVRTDIHHFDVRRTESIVNEKLLLFDYRLNVDRTVQSYQEVPYRYRIQIPSDENTEVAARGISDALDAGIPLLSSEVYDRLGFTVPDGVPDVLRRDDLRNPPTDL